MNKREDSYEKLINTMKSHGLYNKSNISVAYQMLLSLESQGLTSTINHSLRVAITIAKIGFSVDVIAAALLHEVQKYSETITGKLDTNSGINVQSIIEAYAELDGYIQKCSTAADILNTNNQDEVFKKAIYIKLADRIDVLEKSISFNNDSHMSAIKKTNKTLVEIARAEGARFLLDSLENECFRLDNPNVYKLLSSEYYKLLRQNTRTISQTRTAFDNCFERKDLFSTEVIVTPLRYKTISYKFKTRKLVSIYRQIQEANLQLLNDAKFQLNKFELPLFDITLVFNDNDNIMAMDSFIEFYKTILHPLKIRLIDSKQVSDKSDSYILLEDYYHCQYRLFLKSKSDYLKCTYGFGASANIHFRHEEMFSKENKQIVVYDRSNTMHKIEKNSTVLDFAFLLHPDIGYCANFAYINNKPDKMPLNTRLENGDSIIIDSDSQNHIFHVKIDWFEYVNSKKSTKLLVDFFKNNKIIDVG